MMTFAWESYIPCPLRIADKFSQDIHTIISFTEKGQTGLLKIRLMDDGGKQSEYSMGMGCQLGTIRHYSAKVRGGPFSITVCFLK